MNIAQIDLELLKSGETISLDAKVNVRAKRVLKCGDEKVKVECIQNFTSNFINYKSIVKLVTFNN